ncbi:hypothetical protein AZI86_14500 [Bdellovibrio bacteriovorus]|uniref:Outer membrane protein beta-barrel domain-containing protein n=1 Tax=Bdellovibrio bacteriovorus TaxID=959 RepID=A0A150WK01_BDEBC|nr:outer membrane beta-barrel protein [Bdellovibrio bacteriovorus]KYG64014.1 hypothetical protein AZI86_14500 [Bdellovibrio bacteriovorus]
MLNKMVMAAVLVLGVAAHANTSSNQSEFFFQSEAGKSEVTPRIGYKMMTIKPDGATSDTKLNGLFNTGVSYEYGINEMFAIEGALYYGSLETDGTPKTKTNGLQDPEITLKGTSPMAWGNLRYGAMLGLGFEKRKYASATSDGNLASGGYSLAPYIGADMNLGGGIVGARALYEYRMERTIDDGSGTDLKVKDGHELGLSAFYEYFFADMLIGGSINYLSADKVKNSDTGAQEEDSHTTTGISLYTRIPMETWALIPRLDYDFSRSHYSKYDDITLSVAARFGF